MIKTIKSIVAKVLNYFRWQSYVVRNYKARPPVHVVAKDVSGLKVHIGSGEIDLKGWVNVDARNLDHIHIVSDKLTLNEFSNDAIAEIYMCHVLEHLSFVDAESLLDSIREKLVIGGLVRVSVPNFSVISDIYERHKNIDLIKYPLMGGQNYPYNYHKSIYDYDSLSALLAENGYSEIGQWDTDDVFGGSIGDWSDGKIAVPGGYEAISLNIKATRFR